MTTAIFPGSFDPVTNGHLDLIRRTTKLFDEVVVAVGLNPAKTGWLSPDQRLELLRSCLESELPNAAIRVVAFDGLLVHAANDVGAKVIVKGVRNSTDFDSEYIQASANRDFGSIETLLLPSLPKWQYVSSTLVREAFSAGGPIGGYVPQIVADWLEKTKRGN